MPSPFVAYWSKVTCLAWRERERERESESESESVCARGGEVNVFVYVYPESGSFSPGVKLSGGLVLFN